MCFILKYTQFGLVLENNYSFIQVSVLKQWNCDVVDNNKIIFNYSFMQVVKIESKTSQKPHKKTTAPLQPASTK